MAKLKSSSTKRLRWKAEAESVANLAPGYSQNWSEVVEIEIHCRRDDRRFCLTLDATECFLLAKVLSDQFRFKT